MNELQYSILSGEAFKYAFSIVKNEADAQDIVQNAMLKLLMHKESIESPKYYLLKCVKNGALEMFRKQKKEVKLSYFALPDENSETEEKDIAIITETRAKELLSSLDFRTYKMYVKHKQIKKIAKIRKIPEGTAKRQISIMRKNLKAAIMKSNGATYSKDILTFQQMENIRNFIKLICQKKKDLRKLKKYFEFSECPTLDISNTVDWGYRFIQDIKKHQLVISYYDSNESLNVISFTFLVNKRNYMKVVKVSFNRNLKKIEPVNKAMYKKDETGKIIIPKIYLEY